MIWQQIIEGQRPAPAAVVEALLQAEKASRRTRQHPECPADDYSQLLGTWQLRFITGTKRAKQRAGIVLGAGRWLPSWVQIQITYCSTDIANQGWIENAVKVGALQLTVAGPTRFWAPQTILSFDFPQLDLRCAGLTLYSGYVGQGAAKAARFYDQPLKQQAFFHYFLIQDNLIAARGRGGGLAIWVRLN